MSAPSWTCESCGREFDAAPPWVIDQSTSDPTREPEKCLGCWRRKMHEALAAGQRFGEMP